jgi:hypothetical protein
LDKECETQCIAFFDGKCQADKCTGAIISFHKQKSADAAKKKYEISKLCFEKYFNENEEE